MRLLVLGSNGQLGSDLIRAAAGSASLELIPLTRRDLDVTRVDAITDVLTQRQFDVLVNCAAYNRTDDAEHDAQIAMSVNAHAVAVMAETCHRKGARLVHLSTDYVFDGTSNRPYREDDSTAPLSVYGASKLLGESLARVSHEDVLVFRVASLFGVAGSSGKGGNFVETIIRLGRERGTLSVINDQFMSPTASADVARWILDALAQRIPAGTYHAVNSGQTSWYGFAQRIIERAGIDAQVRPIAASEFHQTARRPAYSVLDNSKLASQIRVMPEWTEALDRYLHAKGHVRQTTGKSCS